MWEKGGYLSSTHWQKTTEKPPMQVVPSHSVSEYAWTTPKTRKDVMCRLAFYPGVTSLWIIPPDAMGSCFPYTAFWIADSPINRATVIVRLYKRKHRCSSQKHPYLFAFLKKKEKNPKKPPISHKNMLVYIFQDSEHSPPACYPGRLYDGMVTMETVDKLKMFSLL